MTDWTYAAASLIDVTDGDTFRAQMSRTVDIGFHVELTGTLRQKFRLNGCNAAPIATASGKGAAARLRQLLEVGAFTLNSIAPYKFGDEWMANITLADGRGLTAVMIAEQWAAPWDGRGKAPLPPWPRTV